MNQTQQTLAQGTLTIEGLTKSFGDIRVLDGVSLALRPGRVHALLGHNGSGKSTLIKILAGVYTFDEGVIARDEHELKSGSPRSAQQLGIRFVHQRKNVVEQLPASDNVGFGGVFERVGPFVDWKRQRKRALDAVKRIQHTALVDVVNPMGEGPEIHKTFLAIGRAVGQVDVDSILVLDEPTASLSPAESDELLAGVQRLRDTGVSVLYVSHRLREVQKIADDITVLSDGKVVLSGEAKDISFADIVDALTPEQPNAPAHTSVRAEHQQHTGTTPFIVRGLRTPLLHGIDLTVHPGEIVGVAGLEGSGREEVARALGGIMKDAAVSLLETEWGRAHKLDPHTAVRLGISLALESRAPGALVGAMSIAENIGIRQRANRAQLGRRAIKQHAVEWIDALGILPPDPDTTLELMSGGNRQKVVIASALAVEPTVLVVEDPTAGVDIAAAGRVREVVTRAAREEGLGVLWVSADLEELQEVCDTVVCIADGRVATELGKEHMSERHILEAIS